MPGPRLEKHQTRRRIIQLSLRSIEQGREYIFESFARRDSTRRLVLLLASTAPPSYEDTTAESVDGGEVTPPPPADTHRLESRRPSSAHPRVAVILGVNARWNVLLLICRALSTAQALWWGLRCASTFWGELLLSDNMGSRGDLWGVEKRFRVTEVFLAISWVLANG